ncbi:hypothetical protein LSAJ156_300042 [Latilactobacillus sakei]|nr:hypothetical protein LSAJ156_300042 [Latilactobacillus sakei]
MSAIPIFIISDSIGETARTVIAAVNAQFPASVTLKIQRFPFITDQKTLTPFCKMPIKNRQLLSQHLLTTRFKKR